MNSIKFSHDYEKLPRGWENKTAILLGVSEAITLEKLKELSPEFLVKDTKIRDCFAYYKLEGDKTEYFVLCLVMKDSGDVFTTIRRYTSSKWNYYYNHKMKEFILLYNDGKKDKA